jgi:hypothetical protein
VTGRAHSVVLGDPVLVDPKARACIRWDPLTGGFAVWVLAPAPSPLSPTWVVVDEWRDEGPLTLDEARTAAAVWWHSRR